MVWYIYMYIQAFIYTVLAVLLWIFFLEKIPFNTLFYLSYNCFQDADTEVRLQHWKTRNLAIFNSRVKKTDSVARIFVCLWSDVPQTLTRGVIFQKKLIFLPPLFFKKCIENFVFIENGDLLVFFKPYLLLHFSKWKAAKSINSLLF